MDYGLCLYVSPPQEDCEKSRICGFEAANNTTGSRRVRMPVVPILFLVILICVSSWSTHRTQEEEQEEEQEDLLPKALEFQFLYVWT